MGWGLLAPNTRDVSTNGRACESRRYDCVQGLYMLYWNWSQNSRDNVYNRPAGAAVSEHFAYGELYASMWSLLRPANCSTRQISGLQFEDGLTIGTVFVGHNRREANRQKYGRSKN